MERITLGSKEDLAVRVEDRLGNLTDLSSASPKYDIRVQDATSYLLINATPQVDDMTLLCLVDTTGAVAGLDEVGTYELFIQFTAPPENPRLGPFTFDVA